MQMIWFMGILKAACELLGKQELQDLFYDASNTNPIFSGGGDIQISYIKVTTVEQEWQHSQKQSSRNQINIDKYRIAANITEYHIVSKLIFIRNIQDYKAIISC